MASPSFAVALRESLAPARPVSQALREEKVRQLEEAGVLDPSCRTCRSIFYPHYRNVWRPGGPGPFAPSHKSRVEHGTHCACEECF